MVVKTRAPQNQATTVYYRVPKDYSPNGRESARVLVIFGGRNTTGEKEASGQLGFGQWADEHGIGYSWLAYIKVEWPETVVPCGCGTCNPSGGGCSHVIPAQSNSVEKLGAYYKYLFSTVMLTE